jgi:hypothetical protein
MIRPEREGVGQQQNRPRVLYLWAEQVLPGLRRGVRVGQFVLADFEGCNANVWKPGGGQRHAWSTLYLAPSTDNGSGGAADEHTRAQPLLEHFRRGEVRRRVVGGDKRDRYVWLFTIEAVEHLLTDLAHGL